MEYRIIIKVWNKKKISLMDCKKFSILAHSNIVFILSAVNKVTFDSTHKMTKKVVAKDLFK